MLEVYMEKNVQEVISAVLDYFKNKNLNYFFSDTEKLIFKIENDCIEK